MLFRSIARGKVLLPQSMSNPTDKNNIFYSDLDGLLFTRYPYLNEKDQKPIAIQFELRAAEWVATRNNIVENISSALGVAGSDLFSFLRDATGSSKTATQVASEAQKTISYIMEKRALFTETINEFIQIWKDYYKVTDDFGIRFSSQNHVNMLVTTEQTRVMHEVGPFVAPMAKAPIVIPSTSIKGSLSISFLFIKAPGSPSSALQIIYF